MSSSINSISIFELVNSHTIVTVQQNHICPILGKPAVFVLFNVFIKIWFQPVKFTKGCKLQIIIDFTCLKGIGGWWVSYYTIAGLWKNVYIWFSAKHNVGTMQVKKYLSIMFKLFCVFISLKCIYKKLLSKKVKLLSHLWNVVITKILL